MNVLPGGCRVFDASSGGRSILGNWTSRSVICRAMGATQITQTVSEYATGRSPIVINPAAEEVLYVAHGSGTCSIRGFSYQLHPGTGVYIPPDADYSIENPYDETLCVVHACCPEDPSRQVLEETRPAASGDGPKRTVQEEDRPVIRAGKDREFRYMVHTDLGCRRITQFVGWIPHGKAPFHHHEYEEGIFILDGAGIVHVDDGACEFGPGASIYFPVGVRHCIENAAERPIRLLGAFYPSGSPGAAYED